MSRVLYLISGIPCLLMVVKTSSPCSPTAVFFCVPGSIVSAMKASSKMWSPFLYSHSIDTPGPITSESPYMSKAERLSSRSILSRILSLHGSAPKTPDFSFSSLKSMSISCAVSAMKRA